MVCESLFSEKKRSGTFEEVFSNAGHDCINRCGGVGVMSLVVVLSVMSGFNREVSARLQGFGSHVVLQSNSNENLPNLDDVYDSLDGEHALIREVVKGEVVARSFVSTRTTDCWCRASRRR